MFIKSKKGQVLKLTKKQNSILIGCILGDAYIDKKGKIQIEHSYKQKNYVDWKYKNLESINYGNPKIVERFNKTNQKHYQSYRFWIRQYFWKWRNYFYENNKKIFPKDLKLDPLILAIWYMDDGYYSKFDKRILLATNSFSKPCLKEIINSLSKLNLKSSIKNSSRIYIHKSSWEQFIKIVSPYILSDFKYKLP